VLALFNSSNTVVNQYSYLPFGEAQSTSEGVANSLRFAGRELESQSGLYYNNARWYDPQLHRFISEDPIGIEGGLNLYSYTDNDPVNFEDILGLFRAADRCIDDMVRMGWSQRAAALYCNNRGAFALGGLVAVAPHASGVVGAMIFVPAAHNSVCEREGCLLMYPNEEQMGRISGALSRIRIDRHPFCAEVKQGAVNEINRRVLIYINDITEPDPFSGDPNKRVGILGEAPPDPEFEGRAVMYLNIGSLNAVTVGHEGTHDLVDPRSPLGNRYTDLSQTPLGTPWDVGFVCAGQTPPRLRGR
jgi:RHS repeat-associated protein